MRKKLFAVLAIAIALAPVGCSKKESANRADAAPVEGVPVTPNVEASILSQAADEAIKKKSYSEAVATVIQMGQTPGMTPEQLVAYKNLRRNLQLSLTEAAMAGDQKAQEAIQMLRMASSPMAR